MKNKKRNTPSCINNNMNEENIDNFYIAVFTVPK